MSYVVSDVVIAVSFITAAGIIWRSNRLDTTSPWADPMLAAAIALCLSAGAVLHVTRLLTFFWAVYPVEAGILNAFAVASAAATVVIFARRRHVHAVVLVTQIAMVLDERDALRAANGLLVQERDALLAALEKQNI